MPSRCLWYCEVVSFSIPVSSGLVTGGREHEWRCSAHHLLNLLLVVCWHAAMGALTCTCFHFGLPSYWPGVASTLEMNPGWLTLRVVAWQCGDKKLSLGNSEWNPPLCPSPCLPGLTIPEGPEDLDWIGVCTAPAHTLVLPVCSGILSREMLL